MNTVRCIQDVTKAEWIKCQGCQRQEVRERVSIMIHRCVSVLFTEQRQGEDLIFHELYELHSNTQTYLFSLVSRPSGGIFKIKPAGKFQPNYLFLKRMYHFMVSLAIQKLSVLPQFHHYLIFITGYPHSLLLYVLASLIVPLNIFCFLLTFIQGSSVHAMCLFFILG